MADKKVVAVSKTARSSLGEKGSAGSTRSCPTCGTPMIATKVIRSAQRPGGMYWICPKDEYREKV